MINLDQVRSEFPILKRTVNGKPLVYLDSAATAQKPQSVIQALSDYYQKSNANVHRGAYSLSQEATDLYETAREKIAAFIGARDSKEVIFTRGCTESINLVAQSWGMENIKEGDDVVVTRMEHHSNFVPWQVLAQKKKANFKIAGLDDDYRLDMDSLKEALSGRPKVLAITLQSNVLGSINPLSKIIPLAKERGAIVLVDAAQGVAHGPLQLSQLPGIDFLAFSSHKMCGPTGFGVLWGREELLSQMSPYQYGGDMILQVKDQESLWNDLPWKFEAGTPHISGAVGLAAAIDYLQSLGMEQIQNYENELCQYALQSLAALEFVDIFGPEDCNMRGATISMLVDGVHPHDLATFLDAQGIAVRAGHHCAQPLMDHHGVPATLRASFYFYNQKSEVDLLVKALKEAKDFFS